MVHLNSEWCLLQMPLGQIDSLRWRAHQPRYRCLGENGHMQEDDGWLASLDALRVECDGMARVISTLLQRDGISHTPMAGRLAIEGVGQIVPHCWIELKDGRRIDLRARMWLGDDPRVPHGIVPADALGVQYEGKPFQVVGNPLVFWALTDTTMDAFAPASFLAESLPVPLMAMGWEASRPAPDRHRPKRFDDHRRR